MKKKQDEKLLVGLAAAVALVLIVLGVLSVLSLGKKFPQDNARTRGLAEMTGKIEAEEAAALLKKSPQWEGSKLRGRALDLMTSVPLFKIPGSPDLVDLDAEGGLKVHPPVPNRWWLNNGIDPSYKNSLKRDADADGFTNLEEFEAKTDPTDFSSHPALISKLRFVKSEYTRYKLVYPTALGKGKNQFRYFDAKNPRGLRSEYVAQGGDIFPGTPLEGRFTLTKVEDTEEKKAGYVRKGKAATILDTQRNKSFTIAKKSRNDLEVKVYTITMSLKALGKNKERFTLTENTRFDLPSGKISPEGKFHFVEVKDEKEMVLSYEEGGEQKEKVIAIN